MHSDYTQPSLLSRLRDPANDAAWREFERKYTDLIVRYCRRRGLQIADSEDVVQAVMFNLSRSLRNFKYDPQRGRFRHYLYRAVRGAIFQQQARPKLPAVELEAVALAQVAEDPADVDAVWEEEWTRYHYRFALATLRRSVEPQSIIVFDRLISGDSVETVAQTMNMTTDAVHKVKQRMRKRLEELIAEQISAEDADNEG